MTKTPLVSCAGNRAFYKVGWVLIVLMAIISCTEGEGNRRLAVLTTDEVTEITVNSAVSGGNVTSGNSASVTARGVCWSTDPMPTIDDNKTIDGFGGGSFVSLLTGLEPNTFYYARAYATNVDGTAYGLARSFATEIITITTNNVTEIRTTSAKSGAKIIAISSLTITERGVCWDVNPSPTTSNTKLINGDGGETFESVLTNLTPAMTYYIRAYAITDGFGTYYGDEKTFTTTQ